MHLVHQKGSVKIGEVVRYTLTYTPSQDRILPSPAALHVKIKNVSAIALRAAYLHGPYNIYVAAYPSSFDPHEKNASPRRDGIPQFEPHLKPGGEWRARLAIPEALRETAETVPALPQRPAGGTAEHSNDEGDEGCRSVTWIIEIASQILFSMTASVGFELLVSRDERSLDLGWVPLSAKVRSEAGHVVDHQLLRHGRDGHHSTQVKGVHSRAVRLVVDDTLSLWNTPALPRWEGEPQAKRRSSASVRRRMSLRQKSSDGAGFQGEGVTRQRKVHLVVLTHGLHGNLGADMLFLKESIDATVKAAKEKRRKRKREGSEKGEEAPKPRQTDAKTSTDDISNGRDASTAPLTGGQEQLGADGDDDDDELVIVRGYSGNATKTENGIQYCGKRMAKSILEMTYPDQPYLPVKKSVSDKISSAFSSQSSASSRDGDSSHHDSTVHKPVETMEKRAYRYTSISFVGHSLGGLVQLYAIAYIQKHSPGFFDAIQPVNFVALASPFLGLSNENPVYVKFALDFGLVGRTGQDLGLTWRAPNLAKSGWSAMVGGLGASGLKGSGEEDPGAKPLLRILPTGPAHQVLKRFRNRTVYSNVVNDGIVPLRTSCLLFLDWRGLGKVDKARRENGLIGTMASWGWAEMMGQHSAPHPTDSLLSDEDSDGVSSPPKSGGHPPSDVPQPSADTTNMDDETQAAAQARGRASMEGGVNGGDAPPPASSSAIESVFNFFRLTSPRATKPAINAIKPPSKKDSKMLTRSQTLMSGDWGSHSEGASSPRRPSNDHAMPSGEVGEPASASKRPLATRGDSLLAEANGMLAPPKTSIFESAGDLLSPPIPSTAWINDPSSRVRTIFHDRVYHPEDIPPPPPTARRPTRPGRTTSADGAAAAATTTSSSRRLSSSSDHPPSPDATPTPTDSGSGSGSGSGSSGMRVEEKIARAYHRELSWRKVLVRLEPDAHNNMIVRRMFANAYGWPVVKHLCDTHFSDSFAAETSDERESGRDRARDVDVPVGVRGERVRGQEEGGVEEELVGG